ncbi:KAT8 regulatory NSL complex subunit 1-like isoform X2 [Liolophura sinensis]|uniref:KAT8 regulatory NSL complex subunit 1-like isoform X2 n=1 Tax=Liolophura sinensis TaxID=3198878 RepID=UPI003159453D
MSSPLPLRLCCMAAMAPALTEAATQARIRLPSSPTASPTNTAVNGREGIDLTPSISDCRSNRAQGSGGKGDVSLGTKNYIGLSKTHLQNGGVSLKSHFTQFGTKSKVNLANLGVISNLPNIYKPDGLLAFTKKNGKCHHGDSLVGTMNQQNTVSNVNKVPLTCSDCDTSNSSTSIPQAHSHLISTEGRSNGLQGVEHRSSLSNLRGSHNGRCESDNTSIDDFRGTSELPSEDGLKTLSDHSVASVQGNGHIGSVQPDMVHAHNMSVGRSVLERGKTQVQLERRVEYLMRRLRRLQSKQVQIHVRQQMSGFTAYQNANVQELVKSGGDHADVAQFEETKADVWQAEDVKNLSTVALVSLVKKLQTSQMKPPPSVPKPEPVNVLHLEKEICIESEQTASQLESYIRHVHGAVDSDATESSSGGESADEQNLLPEKEKKSRVPCTPIHRRPEWKWAVDRAGVASRWTWLQAQVSDLEYRIRQQNDIYRQIRANKGMVILGDPPSPEDLMAKSRMNGRPGRRLSPIEAKIASIEKKNEMSPCNISTLLCNVDKQSSKLVQSLGNCLSPSPVNSPLSINGKAKPSGSPTRSINGYVDTTKSSASDGSDVDSPDSSVQRTHDRLRHKEPFELTVSPAVDSSCQAARCRPVQSYRKRKLLRTAGLQTNRKAARLSSVKCQCYPPITACAMCGGRYNAMRKLNPHTMHTQEKISLLDTSTHPILSLPQDTPLPIRLEALLTAGEWQNNISNKSKLTERRSKMGSQLNDHSRKTKRYVRGVQLLTTSKYRRKLDNISRPRKRAASLPTTPRKTSVDGRKACTAVKRRRAAKLAIAAMKRPYRSNSMSVASSQASSGSGSRTPTPSPQTKDGVLNSSHMSATFREMKEAALRKKRVESAYDINNIVIPYSMAASTRVTRLKYKEIVTPKWRDITDPNSEEPDQESGHDMTGEEHQPTPAGDGPPLGLRPVATGPEEEEDEEVEDCSDESFSQRHMKCEGQEKKRFMTFVQYGRRVRGSRTESGANTPDPLSPDASQSEGGNFMGTTSMSGPSVQSVEGVSSNTPTSSSATPTPSSKLFTPIPVREGRESKDNGFRKRSGSMSRRSICLEDSLNLGLYEEMDWNVADPWPLRSFPLEESEYEAMLAEQPSVEELKKQVVEETAKTLMAAPLTGGMVSVSRSSSPAPSTSTSLSEEDPNDPEWTVQCQTQQGPTGLS